MRNRVTLAIDPGADACGWALFGTDDLLVDVGRHDAWPGAWSTTGAQIVVERPTIYDVRRWKGDPNDLISVAIGLGRFLGSVVGREGTWREVRPADWKGQVPKPISHDRIRRQLGERELELLRTWKGTAKHRADVLDAIGLGLWVLGRLTR